MLPGLFLSRLLRNLHILLIIIYYYKWFFYQFVQRQLLEGIANPKSWSSPEKIFTRKHSYIKVIKSRILFRLPGKLRGITFSY